MFLDLQSNFYDERCARQTDMWNASCLPSLIDTVQYPVILFFYLSRLSEHCLSTGYCPVLDWHGIYDWSQGRSGQGAETVSGGEESIFMTLKYSRVQAQRRTGQ